MPNFPIYFKNPIFCPFSQKIFGKNNFFKKIWLYHAQQHMAPYHHVEFQKKNNKLIPRKLPNGRTEEH